jgi:hypothetical protein
MSARSAVAAGGMVLAGLIAGRTLGILYGRRRESGDTRRGPARPDALEDLTKAELYERARGANIPGRAKMSKSELLAALRQAVQES